MLVKIFAAVGLAGLLLGATVWLGNVRLIAADSQELALAHLGFRYNQEPFTGAVYSFANKKLLALVFVWKGLRHGPDIQWYENGKRFVERHYRYGIEFGVHKSWHEDGSAKSLRSFEAGAPHGEYFEWHKNGHPSQLIVFNHGKEVVAKSWTSGGKPFYNYVWRDGSRIGLEGDRFCSPLKNRL